MTESEFYPIGKFCCSLYLNEIRHLLNIDTFNVEEKKNTKFTNSEHNLLGHIFIYKNTDNRKIQPGIHLLPPCVFIFFLVTIQIVDICKMI